MDINRGIRRFDAFQQKHIVLALPYAVIKKFGDDSGGYQAALITYYGFLSLFPLLLVAVTILQFWFANDSAVQHHVYENISNYFPLLGGQLQSNVHSIRRTGVGLAVGILITIYGARGAADALRFSLDTMWHIPKNQRSGFPKSLFQSLGIIGCGAAGFVATALVSGFTSLLGHALWVKLILNLLSTLILMGTLLAACRLATSKQIAIKSLTLGAGIAAVSIQLLVSFGGIIVARELKGMGSVYGTFAIVLGLLFWIYLLAQILVYATEVDTVRTYHLWPRSITNELQTNADREAYKLYKSVEQYDLHTYIS